MVTIITNESDLSTDMSQSYDYVIVGAGSAGATLAARLSEDDENDVLVLEAGGPDDMDAIHSPSAFPQLMKSEVDYDYSSVPQPGLNGREEYFPRGKTLGGSSSTNAMMWVRAHPYDYNHWESLGNDGWGWDDILPMFKRMETYEEGDAGYHGDDGPIHVRKEPDHCPVSQALVDASVEVGFDRNEDINGESQAGMGFLHVNAKGEQRQSTAHCYLNPAMDRDNLSAITHAQVTEVLFDGDQATGVAYVKDGNRNEVTADEEVILSAGAIDSPKLLMLSGIGPADHLEDHGIDVVADLPGVGQNLQDHLIAHATYEITQEPDIRPEDVLCQVVGFERTDPDLDAPDLQFFLARVWFMMHGFQNPDGNGVTLSTGLLRPESRGSIELASDDPTDDPLIDPNYLDSSNDLDVLVKGVERCREIGHANALDEIRGEEVWPAEDDLREHIRETASSVYHPVGTAKMGNDDMAVVDDRLQVHGIDGLRVADASIMPTITGGNTNAPTIAIGERVSDFIRNGE